MKLRLLRDDAPLGPSVVVVRGGELDREKLRVDAVRYHDIYGTYGLSVFALVGVEADELAQQVPLVRFARLSLIVVSALASPPFRLEPTGRNPYHYTVNFDDLEDGVVRLVACEREVVDNPYHEA